MINIKRVYEKPEKNDGFRILVDRLWPRGLSKNKTKIGLWPKDIAPTDSLRKLFSHDPKRWKEFQRKYFKELENKNNEIQTILSKSKKEAVTLLYGAKNNEFNNAVALKQYLGGMTC